MRSLIANAAEPALRVFQVDAWSSYRTDGLSRALLIGHHSTVALAT